MVKVSRPAGVLWVSSAGLVVIVIKLLQEKNVLKKTTNLQSLVILQEEEKVKEDIEKECTNTV